MSSCERWSMQSWKVKLMRQIFLTQSAPMFSWQSVDKCWLFFTTNYGFSHFQKPWTGISNAEAKIEPTTRKLPSGITVVLSPFCRPALWWRTLLKDEGNEILPLFFHRGRLFCGPLLHRQASLCPTCVALRLAQGCPHSDVLLSVMLNPVTSAYQTVLEEMWEISLIWIKQYEQQLREEQMISCSVGEEGDDLRFHRLIAPPGHHPHHNVQTDYEPFFIGSEDAYNITFNDSPARIMDCRDKYVGPVLLTLPANLFAGEPTRLKGYVTSVGHLGKYTKWSPDVTGAGMSFGAEAEWSSVGEAVERYSGNFIPDTLIVQSEQSLRQQSLPFLSQSLFRNLSAFQEDYYASKFAAISHEEAVMWANADPLTENAEPCLIPAEAAYLNVTRYTGNISHFPVVLAGVAAHRTKTEAETSALLEVIERDATMCWWYGGLPARRIINLEENINMTIEPTTPVEQWCLLLDSEFAYVVAGCLYDKAQHILTIGFAARHRVDAAILKALAEAWQLRRLSLDLLDSASTLWTDIRRGKFPFPTKDFREDRGYADCFRADFLDMDQLAYNIQFFLDPATQEEALKRLDGACVSSTNLPPLCDDNPATVRQYCLEQLQDSNFRAWRVDLTTSDMSSCGFSVVRVICPDLAGNAATAFAPLAHPRLVKVRTSHQVPRFYPMPHA